MRTCPVCGGSQFAGHPAGWLSIDHTISCSIRDAEDATRAADYARGYPAGSPTERSIAVDVPLLVGGVATMTELPATVHLGHDATGYGRIATPTERLLLVTLGYATNTPPADGAAGSVPTLPDALVTAVQAHTTGAGILRRRWPQLETTT